VLFGFSLEHIVQWETCLYNGRKIEKIKINMTGAEFNGQPQSLYFPEQHPIEGLFKGMAIILEERGLVAESKNRAECPGFKCASLAVDCCCRRVLFNQPDFAAVESCLEAACRLRGYSVFVLAKVPLRAQFY
jgi:hypothetical protein